MSGHFPTLGLFKNDVFYWWGLAGVIYQGGGLSPSVIGQSEVISVGQSDGGVRIGRGGVGPHGRAPLGAAQRETMGGEPLGAQGSPWEGSRTPPMEGEPLGTQGIP